MRFAPTFVLLCSAGLLSAQPQLLRPPAPAPESTSGPKPAPNATIEQWNPRVDVLDFYGLQSLTPQLVQQASGVRQGSPLPASPGDIEERINDLDRVNSAHLEAICCTDGKTILYIGIEERDAPRFEIRPAPGGGDVLPERLISAYQSLQDAMHDAEKAGRPVADDSHGHPIMLDPTARIIQQSFPSMVAPNLEAIRQILRDSGDEYHRAIAAFLIGYAPRKSDIVEDLHSALTDADVTVRRNAAQSLTALALVERDDPASGIRISPTWFIDMLHSISWSDRMQALKTLDLLTADRDIFTLSRLRGTALDALAEMARWKTEAHAQPAFLLIGRVSGMDDKQIQAAWSGEKRDQVIVDVLRDK